MEAYHPRIHRILYQLNPHVRDRARVVGTRKCAIKRIGCGCAAVFGVTVDGTHFRWDGVIRVAITCHFTKSCGGILTLTAGIVVDGIPF